jgi:hypothetical protein
MRRQRNRQQRRAETADAEDERAAEGDKRECSDGGDVGGGQITLAGANCMMELHR